VGLQVSEHKAAAVQVEDERSGLGCGPVQAGRTAARWYMEVTHGAQLGPLGSSRCPLCGRRPQGRRSGFGRGGDLPCIEVIQESSELVVREARRHGPMVALQSVARTRSPKPPDGNLST